MASSLMRACKEAEIVRVKLVKICKAQEKMKNAHDQEAYKSCEKRVEEFST